MRKVTALVAALAGMLILHAGGVLAQEAPQSTDVDPYIVVLNDNVDNPSQVASGIEQQQNVDVGFVYSHALEGFSAEIPDESLAAVRADPQVDYVEPDVIAYAAEQTLPWGIDRIDADLSSTMAGDGTGSIDNVNAYIIDTGIDASHPDLNVINHVNFRGDGQNYDCNGHGTHVAGTVAARDNDQDVVGVAPGAPLTGVKVLGCGGGGPISGVIKGVDWVTANAAKPAIANMSLDGPASQTLDDAVRKSARSGIFYSIAAGNDDQPACNYSPARAGLAQEDTNRDGLINYEDSNGIVTTAATDKSDNVPDWSNYGRCVDIWAPGVSILSTKLGGGTTTMSGTSMAAPHVGGGGALYLSASTSSAPKDVEQVLKDDAQTPGTLSNAPSGTRYITLEYVGDTTKPLVSCGTADGEWHKDDVSISCTANDAGSGLAEPADASFSLSTSVAEGTETDNAQTNTKEIFDRAGNSVTAGPIGANKVDKKAPSITISTPQDNASYLLGLEVAADYSCTDGGSGVASCTGSVASGDNLDTNSVGTKNFAVEASDKVGNVTSTSYSYTVVYDFGGFFQPVDNPPTFNVISAGRAVPVKFSLSGYQSLDIFAEGYPKSQKVACDSTASLDELEETISANTSGLTYDDSTDQYNYVWKTQKAWAGSCRQLVTKLKDGTEHKANFELR